MGWFYRGQRSGLWFSEKSKKNGKIPLLNFDKQRPPKIGDKHQDRRRSSDATRPRCCRQLASNQKVARIWLNDGGRLHQQRNGRVRGRPWGVKYADRHGSFLLRPQIEIGRYLHNVRVIHALRNPPFDDVRSLRFFYPFRQPQPSHQGHSPVSHGQASYRNQLHKPEHAVR